MFPNHLNFYFNYKISGDTSGIKLYIYYSLLDWGRSDYPFETGNTGGELGRTGKGNYASYFQFMKNQLTELLTNYGSVAGIWFDGHWDQTGPEGSADRSARIDRRYDELYAHIHSLQPQTLIGNNHHLTPFPGEDFQMFEKDLPGENKYGLSFQQASKNLPLETCETMNNSWGFNLSDNKYKTSKELIHYLVNAAGRDTNLLLNVGPMPNGIIQSEFVSALAQIGDWMKENGETIYGTRGNIVPPQNWGTVTQKGNKLYIHILQQQMFADSLFIPIQKISVVSATARKSGHVVKFKQVPEGVFIYNSKAKSKQVDSIIEISVR
jgi:alpha-L-fucosidase